jgi:DNA repair protein RecO (recombination protein O)
MQPLHLAFGGDAEIRTLKAPSGWARTCDAWRRSTVIRLLPFANELVLLLLARDDPHPGLFDAIYANVVEVIASGHGEALQTLRARSSCCCCARSDRFPH